MSKYQALIDALVSHDHMVANGHRQAYAASVAFSDSPDHVESIRSLLADLEMAEKDAERYRWLRDSHPADESVWVAMGKPNSPGGVSCWRHEELDAAIDAALSQLKGVQ